MAYQKEYTFLWFIENYSYCWHRTEKRLISPEFTHVGLEGTAWFLHLYPRGDDAAQGWIVIFLKRSDDNGPVRVSVNVQLAIVAEDGSTVLSKKINRDYSKKTAFGGGFTKMDYILTQRKAEYLPKDILTVSCKLSIASGNAETVAPICARTRIGIKHVNFLHAVDGFSALQPGQKEVYDIYSATQGKRIESCIYIPDCSCCKEKVMIKIHPCDSQQILAKCEVYLLDSCGKKIKCAEADNRFDADRKDIQKLLLSLTKDGILEKKIEYLPNEKLSLLCECIFSTGIEFQKMEGNQNSQTSMVRKQVISVRCTNIFTEQLSACPSALDDLNGIYCDDFLTDVMLKTKSNSFPAHKVVLCARSPVFKAMLSNDMKEKKSGSIEVDDLEDETVKQLLHFLYCDKLDDLQWETASKLYYVADKYEIKKLRLICSSFLVDKLTVPTATELLELADTHSDSDLKKVAENFVLEHDDEIFVSNEWKELMEKNSLLALNTMHLKYETKKKT